MWISWMSVDKAGISASQLVYYLSVNRTLEKLAAGNSEGWVIYLLTAWLRRNLIKCLKQTEWIERNIILPGKLTGAGSSSVCVCVQISGIQEEKSYYKTLPINPSHRQIPSLRGQVIKLVGRPHMDVFHSPGNREILRAYVTADSQRPLQDSPQRITWQLCEAAPTQVSSHPAHPVSLHLVSFFPLSFLWFKARTKHLYRARPLDMHRSAAAALWGTLVQCNDEQLKMCLWWTIAVALG